MRSLSELVMHLRYGVPQWADSRRAALLRAVNRLPNAAVDGVRWFWPAGEKPSAVRHAPADTLRLLAPFDPVVWDRRRFEIFWGWAYRFEAYTPAPQRKMGYYALPLLWRDQVIGWANANMANGRLQVQTGYASGKAPRERAYRCALDQEVERVRVFLRAG
jgi:uncharacterized protein